MDENLAIDGGTPVRDTMLPYSKQAVDESDRKAVERVLRGDWLTTGPAVAEFEAALCASTGAHNAVAVNTGTAALHSAVWAAGIGPDDEVIVPAISFVASSNCIIYQGGTPIFADVSSDTLNIDPVDAERKITPKTKALIVVDFAGHPCDHNAIRELAEHHDLVVIEDASHSLGATYKGDLVGQLQPLTTLSFHPVKHITTGEGGAVVSNDDKLDKAMRSFKHHGIDFDLHTRRAANSWEYDIISLGYNYRISDINCALGTSQLLKLEVWVKRRREIAAMYHAAMSDLAMVELPKERPDCISSWHLYVVKLNFEVIKYSRVEIFRALRAENIGVNVHYIPIPWMTYYAKLGYSRGQWPMAESTYERILSLPIYPSMTNQDVYDVVTAMKKIWNKYRK